MAAAVAIRRADADAEPWLALAAQALELAAIDGACVVGHVEPYAQGTLVRAPDGTLLGWTGAGGTFDAVGRRVRAVPEPEWLFDASRARDANTPP